jgi:hypothetical protein
MPTHTYVQRRAERELQEYFARRLLEQRDRDLT